MHWQGVASLTLLALLFSCAKTSPVMVNVHGGPPWAILPGTRALRHPSYTESRLDTMTHINQQNEGEVIRGQV